MKEINWQELPEADLSAKDALERKEKKPRSPSDTFAARFAAGKRSKQSEEIVKTQRLQPSTYSNQYLQSAQFRRKKPDINIDTEDKKTYQKEYSTVESHPLGDLHNRKKEAVHEEKTIHKKSNPSPSRSRWKNLDLKNRKQTGDLYKKILYFNKKNDSKVFCFTSSRGKEGVSTVLANLVDYIRNQATDKRVMVIDANFQFPSLSSIFNASPNEYDLMDVCSGRIGIRNALTSIGDNIFFLANGKDSRQKLGGLEPDTFVKVLDECRQIVDYVLIDCPPVLISSDALAVAPAADVSFLIIKAVEVQKAVAQKTISLLQDNECQIGGVILNYVQQVIPNWVYKFI